MNTESSRWFKSSHSSSEGGNCVETAGLHNAIGVRDSKDPLRGHLLMSPTAWAALTESMKG